jgi:hypothetical protein
MPENANAGRSLPARRLKSGSVSPVNYFFSGSAPGGSADCTSWPFLPL